MEGRRRVVRYLNTSPRQSRLSTNVYFSGTLKRIFQFPVGTSSHFHTKGRVAGGGMAVKAGVRSCLDGSINVSMMCKWV